MNIEINPLLPKDPKYEISLKRFRSMLKVKKVAQRYDVNGRKTYRIKNGVVRYRKSVGAVVKHEKIEGPFAVVLFKTGGELASRAIYTYQGTILIEEGEFAYIYRDSLEDGYTEAYFCDDTILFMDVRNKETKEKRAVQIEGEPTLISCWDFASNDDKDHTGENMIKKRVKETAERLGLPDAKVFGVIQLDC